MRLKVVISAIDNFHLTAPLFFVCVSQIACSLQIPQRPLCLIYWLLGSLTCSNTSSLPLDDTVTSELSKLLHEIKKCRDRDYSFEELCHTISSHSMDSFGSGRLSDEDRPDRPNGTMTRVTKVRLSFETDLLEVAL